jgi:putative SOS response-associated peptidase YedK
MSTFSLKRGAGLWRENDMCGRYAVLTEEENMEIKEIISEINERFKRDGSQKPIYKSGEIFPTDNVPIITGDESGKKHVNLFKWGFPNFKQPSAVIINARSETLEERAAFKNIFHTKRCLVPASGFYEWKKTEGKKEKYMIRSATRELFHMAGLYNTFKDKNGNPFTGFVIITTEATDRMAEIHNRMPVIFERKDIENWLNNQIEDLAEIKTLLKPYKDEELKFLKVG